MPTGEMTPVILPLLPYLACVTCRIITVNVAQTTIRGPNLWRVHAKHVGAVPVRVSNEFITVVYERISSENASLRLIVVFSDRKVADKHIVTAYINIRSRFATIHRNENEYKTKPATHAHAKEAVHADAAPQHCAARVDCRQPVSVSITKSVRKTSESGGDRR